MPVGVRWSRPPSGPTPQAPVPQLGDRGAQIIEGEGEMLAHVVRHAGLNEMDLLAVGGVQPAPGNPKSGRVWFCTRPIFSV